MPEELFKFVEECDFSEKNAYDVVGGVINQKHLEVVFNSLKECFEWETEQIIINQGEKFMKKELVVYNGGHIVTGKQIGRAHV